MSEPVGMSNMGAPTVAHSQPVAGSVAVQVAQPAGPTIVKAAPRSNQAPQQQQGENQNQAGDSRFSISALIGLDGFKSSAEIHRENIRKHGKDEMKRQFTKQASLRTQEDKEAESEHQSLDSVPLSVDNDELLKIVGQGVAYYFSFLKFTIILNILMVACALIVIVPHLINISNNRSQYSLPSVFYLDSFESNTKSWWIIANLACFGVLLVAGWIYRKWVDMQLQKRTEGSADYVEDPFEGQYSIDSEDCVDRIPYDTPPTRAEQSCRRVFSALCFLLVLVVQGIVNYYAQRALSSLGETTVSVVLSGIIKFINLAWEWLCSKLTVFEKHQFYSDFRRWECFKVFVFKIVNLVVLYIVKSVEFDSAANCPLYTMANQFAFIVIVDIGVTTILELLFPAMQRCCCSGADSGKSEEESKPEFVLSDEYVEVVYRQFVIFLGFPVMPFLPFLGVLGTVVEYWTDKLRLLRIAGKPKRTNNTYKTVLLFFFFLMTVGCCVGYPNGIWFVMAGSGGLKNKCKFYN